MRPPEAPPTRRPLAGPLPDDPRAADLVRPDAAVDREKVRLRRRMVAARCALGPAAAERASRLVRHRLATAPELRGAALVGAHAPSRGEVGLAPLLAGWAREGRLALPRVEGRRLRWYRVADPARDLAPGFAGLAEPRGDCPPVAAGALDAVVLPAVALDPAGRRLGRGGGHVDSLLAELDADRPVPSFGICFALQLVARVPMLPHDRRVGAVVTERGTWTTRPS